MSYAFLQVCLLLLGVQVVYYTKKAHFKGMIFTSYMWRFRAIRPSCRAARENPPCSHSCSAVLLSQLCSTCTLRLLSLTYTYSEAWFSSFYSEFDTVILPEWGNNREQHVFCSNGMHVLVMSGVCVEKATFGACVRIQPVCYYLILKSFLEQSCGGAEKCNF